jgi:hypothetical protein
MLTPDLSSAQQYEMGEPRRAGGGRAVLRRPPLGPQRKVRRRRRVHRPHDRRRRSIERPGSQQTGRRGKGR